MTDIFLYDTGVINLTSETPFPLFEDATKKQKELGEFRIQDPIKLKVTAFNEGISNTSQSATNGLRSIRQRIGTAPLSYSLTAYATKPTVFTGTDRKDLPSVFLLKLMSLSQGYKELYLADLFVPAREELFSLYDTIQGFGTDTILNTHNRRALKVSIDSLSTQESVNGITYNLTLTINWEFE